MSNINLTPETVALVVSLLGNIGQAAKYLLDRKGSAETKAYEQLENLLKLVQERLAKENLESQEKDGEIERLEQCLQESREKVKRARLDLLDLRQSIRNIRHLLVALGVDDDQIVSTVNDLEKQMTEIGDCLK